MRKAIRRLAGDPKTQLIGVLLASETLYLALLRLDATNGLWPVVRFLSVLSLLFALYAAAAFLARRMAQAQMAQGARLAKTAACLPLIAAGAVLFRLTLLPAGLPHDAGAKETWQLLAADVQGDGVAFERFQLFDSDIWRYLWDGHVSAHGMNPYVEAPASPALDHLTVSTWSEIRDNINHPHQATVYPPLAQIVFRVAHGIAPGSVLAMKALVTLADLLAALFLWLALRRMNLPAESVLLYAWNPLVVKAFAGSGHIDAVAVLCLAVLAYAISARLRTVAAIAFALSVLAKLFPLLLAPFVARRIGWRNTGLAGAALIAGFAVYADAGSQMLSGLLTFSRYWRFNGGPWQLIERSGGYDAARVVCGTILLLLVIWLAYRDDGEANAFFRCAAVVLGCGLLFSPVVMPWYVPMVLPLAVLAGQSIWIWFSALVCLAFHVMIDQREREWVVALEYLLFFALVLHGARLSVFLRFTRMNEAKV